MLKEPSEGIYKEKGSKFFAYAYPILKHADWETHLEGLKKEHGKARHHCFAYRLGIEGEEFRTNDDGEPSGTAGKPILGQIDSFEITNVFCCVVRYFGGTKLGASGLITAYRTAARESFNNGEIIIIERKSHYLIQFDYVMMNDIMTFVKKKNIEVVQQDFMSTPKMTIAFPLEKEDTLLIELKAAAGKISYDYASSLEIIPGLVIDKI